jgi:hypothetical protein
MAESLDTTLLLELLKEIREEMRSHRALLMESIDRGRCLERHMDTQLLVISQRVSELKDDLELAIKSELMGLIGEFEGRGRGG